jgi:ribonuclease HI
MIFHATRTGTQDELPMESLPVEIETMTENYVFTTKQGGFITQRKNGQENSQDLRTQLDQRNEDPLFHHIELLMEQNEIDLLLKGGKNIKIASDGGYNPKSGISTYGWIVLIEKQPIAKGRGPAAAHPTMAESFRAEGFGIASAASFLQVIAKQFQLNVENYNWHFFIDNKAMITRMESYSTKIQHSQWNLRSDADITNQAATLLQGLPVEYHHVKSHQDKNRDNRLSFEAQINIIADEMATRQRQLMTKPFLHAKKLGCTLSLDSVMITRDSQKWLIDSASRIPMMDYFHKKLKWTAKIFHSIEWDIQHTVLNSYDVNDQRRILKFCHGWLPTNKRLHREGLAPSARCPLCNHLEETNLHLLVCPHQSQQKIRDDLYFYLQKDIHNMGNGELNNIIEIALQDSVENQAWTPDINNTSNNLRDYVIDQNCIGWNQLYNGRIAKSLVHTMDEHFNNLGANGFQYSGKRWTKMLIRNIWNTVLKLWKNRNDFIYKQDRAKMEETIRENLANMVATCFGKAQELTWQDRNIVFQ